MNDLHLNCPTIFLSLHQWSLFFSYILPTIGVYQGGLNFNTQFNLDELPHPSLSNSKLRSETFCKSFMRTGVNLPPSLRSTCSLTYRVQKIRVAVQSPTIKRFPSLLPTTRSYRCHVYTSSVLELFCYHHLTCMLNHGMQFQLKISLLHK